jgi:tape measure domain-containing protein
LAFGGDEIARAQLVIQATIDDRQITDQATRAANAFNRQFQQVQKQLSATGRAQQVLAVESINKAFGGLANRINFAKQQADGFGAAINRAATATKGLGIGFAIVSAAVGAAALKITKSFAETAGNFQELRQSLDAIIKNSATANTTTDRFVKSLRNLALQSGRSSTILFNTGRQFLALGFSADKATEILTTFTKAANLTGASNEQLRLALNGVSQIASKGAVAMEELRRQIAENLPGAINLSRFFEILGKQLGITADEARRLQEQGKITAEQGIPALIATVNEAIGDIDVFALRLNTLSGALGVIRERFKQAVEDGFQPFIRALLGSKEAAGPLREALTGLQENGNQLQEFINRLGVALGTTFAQSLRAIIPLLPQLAEFFVTLVEVVAPVTAEIIEFAAGIANLLLPPINTFLNLIDILLNKIPVLSDVLRALAAALLVKGAIDGFRLLGSAVLASTGLVGSFSRAVIALVGKLPGLGAAIDAINAKLTTLSVNPALGALLALGLGIKFVSKEVENAKKKGIGEEIANFFGFGPKARGIGDFFESDAKKIVASVGSVEEAVDKMKNTVTPGFSELNAALTPFVENLNKMEDAAKKVTEAQQGLTAANQSLSKATQTLKDLEKERAKVAADTARDVRELAEAEEDLTRIRFRLRDLDEEEADILAELAELRTPASARDLAAADRDVERATIALNKAKRDEAALLKGLNKDQKESVNLEGLSLDQIRAKLANIRATNAARKKEESGEKTLEEQQTEARLNVADAEEALNKAKEARNLLDDKVKNNAEAIRELEERLVSLSLDRAGALRDEGVAQDALNTLRSGETARAIELRDLDKEIKAAKEGQKTAIEGVRDATLQVRDAEREQKQIVAEIKGDQETINGLLLKRIELNKTLIAQNPELRAQLVSQLTDLVFQALGSSAFGFTDIEKQIADALLKNPNDLLDILRRFGVKLAEGGLVTRPTFAQIGEQYRPEVVLPLTKPDRVWSLLSQTLPKYPGALAAAQQAIQPSIRPTIQLPRGSGGNRPGAGPMTADQADEIIRLLKANGKSQVTVEAPVQIMSPVQDADALARKVAQRVERSLARGL